MDTYPRVAELPLVVEDYALEGLSRVVSSGFERPPTVIRLRGAGEEGVGEDVTYEGDLQQAQQQHGPTLELAGTWTFDSFSRHLDEVDAFPAGAPDREVYRNYRRWAFESAALDLALRQAGMSLADALGRSPGPVTFVVSTRMGDPPSYAVVANKLALYPDLRFKLDATPDWDDALIEALIESGSVDSIDLKGA